MLDSNIVRKKNIYTILFFIGVLAFCISRAMKGSDFDIYLSAAKMLLEGKNIYDAKITDNVQYFYSPLFATILSPLTYIPAFFVKLLWLIFTVFCIYSIWQHSCKYLDFSQLTSREKKIVFALPHLLLIGFTIDHFHMIQMTYIILWMTFQSLFLIKNNRWISGALLLGLAIIIKLLPLLFIPYLIYRGKIKSAVLTILVLPVLVYLPSVFIGSQYNHFLTIKWWETINPLQTQHLFETNSLVFNLDALITSFFVKKESYGFLINIDHQNLRVIILLSKLFFCILTLGFLQTFPFSPSPSKIHEFREISYLLLVTVLVFPHQNKYANVYLIPAYTYLVYFLISFYKLRFSQRAGTLLIGVTICIIGTFLISFTGRSIVGEEIYNFLSIHKSITIGTILLIIPLLIFTPSALTHVYEGSYKYQKKQTKISSENL